MPPQQQPSEINVTIRSDPSNPGPQMPRPPLPPVGSRMTDEFRPPPMPPAPPARAQGAGPAAPNGLPPLPPVGSVMTDEFRQQPTGPKNFLDQLYDLISTSVEQVNPFPALYKANYELAGIMQDALSGHLKDAGGRVVDDLLAFGEGLATAANLPTNARSEIFVKGKEALEKGDTAQAAAHFTDWLLPLIGPSMSEAATEASEGNWGKAGGIGIGQGTLLSLFGLQAAKNVQTPKYAGSGVTARQNRFGATTKRPPPAAPPDIDPITHLEKVKMADEGGMPMSAGSLHESPFLRSVEQTNAGTALFPERVQQANIGTQRAAAVGIGRGIKDSLSTGPANTESAGVAAQNAATTIAESAAAQDTAIAGAYGKASGIVQRAVGPEVTAASAGQGLLDDVIGAVHSLRTKAKGHYDKWRAGMGPARDVTTTERATLDTRAGPVTQEIPVVRSMEYPLDISAAQKDLMDFYNAISPKVANPGSAEIRMIGLMEYGPAYSKLENLVNAGSKVPWQDLEEAIGALKSLQRRSSGRAQGLAGAVISRLERVVREEVKASGGEAFMEELLAGREAVRMRYELEAVLAQLGKEPVQAASRATSANRVKLMAEALAAAPGSRAALARLDLQGVMDVFKNPDNFTLANVRSALSKWEKKSPELKQALYPEQVLDRMDRWFEQARKAVERQQDIPSMKDSPVAAFKSLVASGDHNVHLLRTLTSVDPGLGPMLGRAYFHDVMKQLFASENKIESALAVRRGYRSLGPETRRILFGSSERQIRTFVEMMADEGFVANPSRTTYTAMIASRLTGAAPAMIAGAAIMVQNPMVLAGAAVGYPALVFTRMQIQKMLWNPNVAKYLNAAMKTPASEKGAIAASARLLNAARREGIIPQPAPATAASGALNDVVNTASEFPRAAERQDGQPQPPPAQGPQPLDVGRFTVTEQPPAQ
jgi:hypothetical protein